MKRKNIGISKMKLSDYVIDFLVKEGIQCIFGLTGGALVHLFDSVAKNKKIFPVFTHHEQAALFAAEAYSRVTNNLGAAFVTTGPGGTNAITGLCAAWLDSIPCIFISGQARFEHTTQDKPIRQLGSQQINIVSVVAHFSKYAVMVDDPNKIKYYLQKAIHIARTGRPGPVWIDLPLNFQWVNIEPEKLPNFDPVKENLTVTNEKIEEPVKKCVELIKSAKRPLVLVGYGARLSHSVEDFRNFIEKYKIPFVSTWNASDIIPTDNKLYVGRIGISGQRGANLAVQNCDLLLSIGSHLSIPLTGTNYKAFAREAKKIIVDIDKVELDFETVKVDLPIHSDVKIFLSEILKNNFYKSTDIKPWLEKCFGYKTYNIIPNRWKEQKEYVNPYVFIDALSDQLNPEDVIVVDGGGTALYMSFQAMKLKEGQRMISSAGIAAMGSGVPESIGACFANDKKRTICFCGDGSMQLNIQELQTIYHHNLPIKIILFNNQGYLAIRHTQTDFLNCNFVGSDAKGGVSLPDFQKVVTAYGIKIVRVNNHKEMLEKIKWTLKEPGPVVCEIMISKDQELIPRMGFKKNPDGTATGMPLEDMCPFLERREFIGNMIVKPWK